MHTYVHTYTHTYIRSLRGTFGGVVGLEEAWAMVRECFGEAWVLGESWGMFGNSLGRLGDGWGGMEKVW